jgi:hypothetical protein
MTQWKRYRAWIDPHGCGPNMEFFLKRLDGIVLSGWFYLSFSDKGFLLHRWECANARRFA